jgi:hypothetical protein
MTFLTIGVFSLEAFLPESDGRRHPDGTEGGGKKS